MKIKNVSMAEFKNFVLSQPDDRMIDFDYKSTEDLGCPLVHFTRNKFKRKVTSAGWFTTETDRHLVIFDDNIRLFMQPIMVQNVTTYKRVKTLIQKSL